MNVMITCLLVALAHADELVGPSEPVGIYGGTPVAACGWPTTVFVNDCTGTLVHPRVVVLAAHCIEFGGQPTEVLFGENYYEPARTVGVDNCTAHPDWQDVPPGDGASDIAVCQLAEPVDDVAIVPILMGCETDALEVGASVTIVGFGDGSDQLGHGPKREVVTEIQQVGADAAWVGGNGESSCYGDSGGPAYIQLTDGSWRVFGATSGSATDDEGCGQTSIWTLVHVYAPWIEQTTGVDVTPCHDADGVWNPGEGCVGFPMSPGANAGAWNDGCSGEVSGVAESCGPGLADTTTSGDDPDSSDSDAAADTSSDGTDDDAGQTATDDNDSGTTASQGFAGEEPPGCGCRGGQADDWTVWSVLFVVFRRKRSGSVHVQHAESRPAVSRADDRNCRRITA